MDQYGNCTSSWIWIVNPTLFQFLLCILKHLLQVRFNLFLTLKLIQVPFMRKLLNLWWNIIIRSLTGFSPWRSMPIIYSKKATSLTYVLQYAACILTLLLLWSWPHQRRHIHFNIFNNICSLFLISLLILFLLLLALSLAEDT